MVEDVELSGKPTNEEEKEMRDLLWLLGSGNDENRMKARKTITEIGVRAVPVFLEILMDNRYNSYLNGLVSSAIVLATSKLEKVKPELIAALQYYPSFSVRVTAANVLGEMGEKAVEAIPALFQALSDTKWKVRASVILALGEMGNDAVPLIIIALFDEEKDLRSMAFNILRKKGKLTEAIPALLEALKEDEDWQIRAWSATALGDIREKAVKVVPALIEALKDDERWPRVCAALELGKFRKKTAIPALKEAMMDKDWQIRSHAAISLLLLDEQETAYPVLIDELKAKNYNFQGYQIIRALEKIGEELIPELNELVTKTNKKAKRAIKKTLEKMAIKNGFNNSRELIQAHRTPEERREEKIKDFIEELNSFYPKKRQKAAYNLGLLKAEIAVRPLKERLINNRENTLVRAFAALSLGRIGGKEATRFLRSVSRPRKEDISLAIEGAILKLDSTHEVSSDYREAIDNCERKLEEKYNRIYVSREEIPETWWGKNKDTIYKIIIAAISTGIGALIKWLFDFL
ncbi:MAG: HEAT repeat domain-containing protein [Candidatus Heimdallarchaeaceae archaeon]